MYCCLSVNPKPVRHDLPKPVPHDLRPVLKDLRPVSEDTKSSQGSWGIREILNTNTSTVVFASAFLVSLVVMAVVVRYFLRKRKTEDHQALLVSDWEK